MRRKLGTLCVVRASGSHGPFDLIRIQKRQSGEIFTCLVQIKASKPNEKEIADLAKLAYGRSILSQVWIWKQGVEFEKWCYFDDTVDPGWSDAITGEPIVFKTRRSKKCS